jgi:carbon-monoxide dehydrogenase large subunit
MEDAAAKSRTLPPLIQSADFRFIGKPIVRKEDERLVTGKGRFTDDFKLDRQAYAVMVRSPYPHARIRNIESVQAKAMPGVLAVFTGPIVRTMISARSRMIPCPKRNLT